MKFFLVDVKSITPSKPLEQFDKAEVEKLADSILECNGLLKPLILKPTGPESYVVIQGNMEFHAAVKAREKDPRKGEMVNAFVISPKAEETVLEQIQTLQGVETPSPREDTASVCRKDDSLSSQLLEQVQAQVKNINRKIEDLTSLPSQVVRMMQQLQLLERDFDESLNGLKQKTADLETLLGRNFNEFLKTVTQKTADLETLFNQKFKELSELIVKPPPPPELEKAFLDFLNNSEELELIDIKGIKEKTAKKIIGNRKYISLKDVKKKLGTKNAENWLKSFSEKNL